MNQTWDIFKFKSNCTFSSCVAPLRRVFWLQLGSGVPQRRQSRPGRPGGLSVHFPRRRLVRISPNRRRFTSRSSVGRVFTWTLTRRQEADTLDNGFLPSDTSKTPERSSEDLSRGTSESPSRSGSGRRCRATRATRRTTKEKHA